MSKGIDFVDFRNFYHHNLLRKRNINSMQKKIELYKNGEISFSSLYESYRGWQAYAKWANTHKLSERLKLQIIDILWEKL